jgi:long-chain acyl-CoA synthetase
MKAINLADAFIGTARYYDDRPAIVSRRHQLTHGQLIDRAARSANLLRKQGIVPGDIVGIALPDPGDVVILAIACWMVGATIMILDFRSRADERTRLSRAFGVTAILEERAPPGKADYSSIRIGEDWAERVKAESVKVEVAGNGIGPAILSLTSGTTGRPQGIQLSHATFLFRQMMHEAGGSSHANGIFLNSLSIHFSASRNHTFGRLLGGGAVHFAPLLSTAEELKELLLSRRATCAFIVPAQLIGLLHLSEGRREVLFPSLRTLNCGGQTTLPHYHTRAYHELSNNYRVIYGSSIVGTISELSGESLVMRPETVGRPSPMINIQIVDDSGKVLPAGEEGNIRVRSPAIADGIAGDVVDTSDRLADGWAYPGDMGSLDHDGFLTLAGRASDMIIRGGANVFPEEVEAALRSHPHVTDIAVTGIPDENMGEEIAAFVVADAASVTAEELSIYARSRLSPDKRPRHYFFVKELPRSEMGKLLRRKLKEQIEVENSGVTRI